MKRTTILALAMALILALVAGTAVAQTFTGTKGPDKLIGTDKADTMIGGDGADRIYGRGGPDSIRGDYGSDPVLRGRDGNDKISGGVGADSAFGDTGNDTIRMVRDPQSDFVNCGDDASGTDIDTAYVSGNDAVDGVTAGGLTTTTGLSCERLFVDGVQIPQI